MDLDHYLQEKFPHIALRPPLFYSSDVGIRFELGVHYDSNNVYENCEYVIGVYNRAITLFKAIHSPEDEMYVVVNVNDFGDGTTFKCKLNIFSKYVKEKSVLIKLKQNSVPYIYPEDDESGTYKTHRFTLKCSTSDLQYAALIKAICNQDLGLKPSIYHDIYFVNMNKETIFHVYDDRGCDLIATSPNTIRGIYEEYNDWILDYDRVRIDKVFKKR